VVVLPEERPGWIEGAVVLPKVACVVTGGPTRQASLGSGLACLPDETGIVLVHDAARPLVRPALVERVVEAVGGPFHGAVPALPLDDAVKEVSREGEVLSGRSRRGLWSVQTPQGFLREPLEEALARADAGGAVCEDCSEMALRAGYRVRTVVGDPLNLKVTRAGDLPRCESILVSRRVQGGSSPERSKGGESCRTPWVGADVPGRGEGGTSGA
jgi:4-diphosphocytidyl-2-methyl-D-erithritol synthase